MRRDGWALRAYRLLVHLYPRRFRDEYGADMTELMREQCRHEPTTRVFVRVVMDAAVSIPTQHLEVRMRSAPNRLVALAYASVSLAGLVVAVVGGSQPVTIVLGLGLAAIAGTLAVTAWRRSAPPRAPQSLTASWWKFLAAGPSLIALVIVAAGVGVNAWYLGMLVVAAAVVVTATGVVLAVAHLFRHRLRRSTA